MKKLKTENQSVGIICLGIVLMLIFIVLLYLFRASIFRNEKYKEELGNKIFLKQQCIINLRNELQIKKELHDLFKNEALRFYKTVKIVVVIATLGVGFICCAVFSFGIIGTIGAIVSVITIIYQAVTIVFQNKIGDFNITLIQVEEYFIRRTFRKNAFEPVIIAALEEQLNNEQKELAFLQQEYDRISNSAKIAY